MHKFLAAAVVCLALAVSASAQETPEPSAATSVSAAEAALAAAEARAGANADVAERALDLAVAHMEAGNRAAAQAPARRALEIATSGGLDATRAQIVLARAELSETPASRARLLDALSEPTERPELARDLYLAAADLGRTEMRGARFPQAAAAWAIASRNAESADGDTVAARASALTLEGVALVYTALSQRRSAPGVMPQEEAAHARLHEAVAITLPATALSQSGELMSPQIRINAMARAWHSVLDSRLGEVETPWRAGDEFGSTRMPSGNYCPVRLIAQPLPRYPLQAQFGLRVAAVVVRFHFDESGEIIRREVAAAAPASGAFTNAVMTAANRWRVEWVDGAPAGCSKQWVYSNTIVFTIPD